MATETERPTQPPHLAHHFDDLKQQGEAFTMGMWIFLVTEVMIFGGLFAGYTVYRFLYPTEFAVGTELMNWQLASLNTLILIASSLTIALAVYSAQMGQRSAIIRYLALTILLGLAFLGFKAVEYTVDVQEGLLIVKGWYQPKHVIEILEKERDALEDDASESAKEELKYVELKIKTLKEHPERIRLFLVFYYVMTGLHAIHMIGGMIYIGFLIHQTRQGKFSAEYHPQIELFGLYWHFVDVVWIFLLPLLYLSGLH